MAARKRYTEGRLKAPDWRVPFSISWRTTPLMVSWGYFWRHFQQAWQASGLALA